MISCRHQSQFLKTLSHTNALKHNAVVTQYGTVKQLKSVGINTPGSVIDGPCNERLSRQNKLSLAYLLTQLMIVARSGLLLILNDHQ